jgi:hypothetical protein
MIGSPNGLRKIYWICRSFVGAAERGHRQAAGADRSPLICQAVTARTQTRTKILGLGMGAIR